MSTSFVDAKEPSKKDPDETQGIWVDVYVGVFFDGTNNNMMQAMIGQKFRRDKVFKSRRDKLKEIGVNSVEEVIARPRTYWNNGNIFTKSDLDQLYGTASSGDNSLEKEIVSQNNDYSYSSVQVENPDNPINFRLSEPLQNKVEEIADPNANPQKSHLPDYMLAASFSQGSTYTNPCILWSMYNTGEETDPDDDTHKIYHHRVYVEGSGADSTITLAANVDGAVDNIVGLGFGVGHTGVAAKCRKMVQQINNIYGMYHKPNVKEIRFHFDVFGFSRGSATARLFTYLVNPKQENNISNNDFLLFTGKAGTFLPLHEEEASSLLTKKEVRTLGIYDTVASIGILRDPFNTSVSKAIKINENVEFSKYGKSQYHDRNVDDFGLYATTNANDVLHICALDENRVNFSLTDIESSIVSGNGTEIFLPGCHTDIGGGASLGLDGLKVINKEASNVGEIFGCLLQKVQEAKGIASKVISTVNNAKRVASGVKKVIDGVRNIQSGLGAFKGVKDVYDGLCSTYDGVRSTVAGAHDAVSTVKDMLTDVQQQAGGGQQANSQTKTIPNYTDGLDDFAKKGIVKYVADATGSKKIQNIANQMDKFVDGGNQLVDGVANAIDATKALYDKGPSNPKSFKGAVDQAEQTINSAIAILQQINSAAVGMSTVANSIKSAIKGRKSTDQSVAAIIGKLTSVSNAIIGECEGIKNDIALSKETLDILRTLKEKLTEKNEALVKNLTKTKIDTVNDALDGVAKTLANCDTAISGIQTMMKGMDGMDGIHGSIGGIHDMAKGLMTTYQGVKDSIGSVATTSTGIWNNLENLYTDMLNGLITPETGSGQGSRKDIEGNLEQTATGLSGMGQSYQDLEQNVNAAFARLKGIKGSDFGSVKGVTNSLTAASDAIKLSEDALKSLKSMIDSTKQASSNILGLGKNVAAATTNLKAKGNLLDSLKETVSDYTKPATGSGSNVMENMASNLQNAASGLSGTVGGYESSLGHAQNAIGLFKGIGNHNLHSLRGILGAFSDTSKAITESIQATKDFKSMLENVKQLTTNTVGLGTNMVHAVSQGYQSLKGVGSINPSQVLKDFLTPETGSSGSVIENLTSNVSNVMSGIQNVQAGYNNALSNAANAMQKVKGLKSANLHSVNGIVQALTDSASAIQSTVNVFNSLPKVVDSIKQTSTNILGIGKNLQRAFTIENGHFVIVNECSKVINEKCNEMKETFNQAKETANDIMEIITGKKKLGLPSLTTRRICFYNFYPCSEPNEPNVLPVSFESLQALGWVGADSQVDTDQTYWTGRAKKETLAKGETVVIEGTKAAGIKKLNNIGIYKYVYPGYSNITLKMMVEWCAEKVRDMFKPLNEMRYAIPDDLVSFYGQIAQSCLKSKGRYFCVPKYDDTYRKTRLKYLHFSMNQQLLSPADNTLVNGPSLALLNEKLVIIRRIYIGKSGSPTAGADDSSSGQLKYLYNYIGHEGTLKVMNFNVTEVQVSK